MSVNAPWTPIAQDVQLIDTYAELRARNKKYSRQVDWHISEKQGYARGLVGEVLFERTFGWPFDRTQGWDGGVDFVVGNVPVGLKTAHVHDSDLIINEYQGDRPPDFLLDVAAVKVLVLVTGSCVQHQPCPCATPEWWYGPWSIRGWIRVSEFKRHARHWIGKAKKGETEGTGRWSVGQHLLQNRWNEHWFRNEGPKVNEINWG